MQARPPFHSTGRTGCVGWAGWGLVIYLLSGIGSFGAEKNLINVWTADDGLPASSVTALAQTPDGFLWVGTYNGLARFDGVRFKSFFPASTPELTQPRIQALAVDTMGTLWITTFDNSLVSYREGQFHLERRSDVNVPLTLAVSTSNSWLFNSLSGETIRRELKANSKEPVWTDLTPTGGQRFVFRCVDGRGDHWFTTRDLKPVRLTGDQFNELPAEAFVGIGDVLTLVADHQGTVWAGTSKGTWRWDGSRFEDARATNGPVEYPVEMILPMRSGALWVWGGGRLRKMVERRWVREVPEWDSRLGYAGGHDMLMNEDAAGGIWLAHYGNGLFHVSADGERQHFSSTNGLPGDRIWTWFGMQDGTIWAGVDRGGLVNIRKRQFQVISQAEGLPSPAVLSVCEDDTGTLWFGTSGGGLCREVNGRIESVPVSRDAAENFVFSMAPQPGVGLWLSASAGEDLFLYKDGQIQHGPWAVHGIKSMLVDRSQRLWMGTKTALNWWTPTERRSLTSRDGLASSPVRALIEDSDGQVWCGTDDGSLYRCTTNAVKAFHPTDRLAGAPISAMLADSNKVIWIGTFSGGLLRFKDGGFKRVTSADGLPSDLITQLLEDDRGWLWMGTQQGLSCVAKSALHDFLDGKSSRVDCISYGLYDGLPTVECAANYQPACWRAQDGRLWFATMRGVVSVQPEELHRNPTPPTVVIEGVFADGEWMQPARGQLVIPPGRRRLEFQYTALSFKSPDRILFRYRLSKLNEGWVEAGTQRTVNYSMLPPGEYKFQVLACNSDGVWNETGATVDLTVKPYFYQTGWFAFVLAAAILGGFAIVVRRHTARKYRARLQRLEQQHAIEQDRARIAKDIHDDLGAELTQIALLSELTRQEPPEHTETNLRRISDSARRMTRAMDEIVWAVDPQHDSLAGFIDYASVYAEDFLRTAGVLCRIDVPLDLPSLTMDAEVRYNLFLALKETLNNIVKHASATKVQLTLRLGQDQIILVVQDDGRGFKATKPAADDTRLLTGHGLINLEQRLGSIGGSYDISSDPEQGTRVELSARVPGATSPIVATSQAG
jgi:signal transduction histidine kinase/ligand-binding sensor domain-containing protein